MSEQQPNDDKVQEEPQAHAHYTTSHEYTFTPPRPNDYLSSAKTATRGESVPLDIFSTKLSTLQAIVRYLHDERRYSFSQIARVLNRSPKSIWTTYQQGRHQAFSYVEGGLVVPLDIFASRALAPLESIVTYLAKLGFQNVEVARLLNRDPRTTWTVARRATRKEGNANRNENVEVDA